MRVAISATGGTAEAQVSPIFGRCDWFVVMDTESEQAEGIANPALGASGGAGVQAAQFVARQGVQAVISGNVGPKAMQVLQAAGIAVYAASDCTVSDAVAALGADELELLADATVGGDFGKAGGGRR